ncbi:MAG: RnfABCDGE type electron transport complex subunit D [Candidatus Cloacimonetes bacterium]|nr:RnfABCDGE type electron transport complex subunit D [Candidatus Cloacimonadota bacterium]
MKQKVMNRVLYALVPIIIYAVFRFGWRVVAVIAVSNLFAVLTEYMFVRGQKSGKISGAVWVTGTLLALILPPAIPFWMAAVGAVVAISFGKMVFGGFGMNPFNPALVGRIFVFISFPKQMGTQWTLPFARLPGGFGSWANPQALTAATRISEMTENGVSGLGDLFFGNIPGCMGEISSLLIIAAAIYLIISKTAKWQPIVGGIISFLVFSFILYGENPLYYLFAGGVMFGMVFMLTDPVSMPKHKAVIWINAILTGFLVVLIRKYSSFPEGFMFALLLSNTFSPIIEYAFTSRAGKGK